MTPLRCRFCRKGFSSLERPAFRCPRCNGGQWVAVPRLRLADRLRVWRDTGHKPWERFTPDPEVYGSK
jgi:hypothetical protein